MDVAGTLSVTGKAASLFAFTVTDAGALTVALAGPTDLVTEILNLTAYTPSLWIVTKRVELKSVSRSSNPNERLSFGVRTTA